MRSKQPLQTSRTAGVRRVAGQALVELLVAMLVLLPAFVLITLFGKYQAVHWATIAAARDLAFDCAFRTLQCAQADAGEFGRRELLQRMFDAADAPPQSGVSAGGSATSAVTQPLWVDGRGQALLGPIGDVDVSLTRPSLDAGRAVARSYRGGIDRAAQTQALEQAGPSRFGWQMTEGLLVAQVRSRIGSGAPAPASVGSVASLAAWQAPHTPRSLRFSASSAIVADAWNASGPDVDDGVSVAARIAQGRRLDDSVERQLEATYAPLIRYGEQVRAIGLERNAPAQRDREPDPDLVPADRLQERP